jgi:UDP-3-O-[3-hydroxymyristoyl] N-acetylglucosamine deacetylase
MGALFGLGIDNALIEIDNEEVPILDGSAKNFIEKIISAGIKISESPIKIIKINKRIEFSEGERFISIKPSTLSLDIDFQLKYNNEIISNQRNKVKVYEDDLTDIYNSRTFCLFEDIELIKKNGLAKGGSLDNAIVVKDDEVLNPEGLRNSKEFVNHKILDCIGDLYTSGYRMLASITCSQGGHYLTNQLLRKVFQNKDNFSIIEIKEKNLPHTLINRNLLRSIA